MHVYGPARPARLPAGDADFHRQTTIHPERPAPGTPDLVGHILAGYAYHLNVMPLDAAMPDPGQLVRAADIAVPARAPGQPQVPTVGLDDRDVRVRSVAVTHGHAIPALAYRFDTADGSVVFSGDTTVNGDLIALAQGADILVPHVADLGYLKRQRLAGAALDRMAGLHTDVTEVGAVAERAGRASSSSATTLPAEPSAVSKRTGSSGPGRGSTAPPPRAGTGCAGRCPARGDGDGGRHSNCSPAMGVLVRG